MNNKYTIILFLILLTQIFSTFRLNSINNEIIYLRNENQSLHSQLKNQLTFSISDLNRIILESSNPIEQASITYGTINKEDFSIEVIFNVVPKELTPATNVFLEINGEKVQLSRNSSVFSLSMEFDIFSDDILPLIIIEDNEKQIITQESRLNIYDLRYSAFPVIDLQFGGETKFWNSNIQVSGEISALTIFDRSKIEYTSFKVVYFLDNVVIGQQNLVASQPYQNGDMAVFNLDNFFFKSTSSESSIFSIVFIATNEFGFEQHILVSQSNQDGSNHLFCYIYNIERIYSPTKEFIWQTNQNDNSNCIFPQYK